MRRSGILLASIWLIGGPVAAQPANPPDRDTIDFVKALRNSDGGYAPAPDRPGTPVRSSLRATTTAIRALKYLAGGEPTDTAATAQFVEKCFDKSTGGFCDFPGEAPIVGTTAVGAMAVIDLKMPPEPFRDGVVKYLNEQTKTVEDMRIAAAAFEALHVRPPKADDWLKQIAATRNAAGTFGTDGGVARATGGTAVLILRLGGALDNRDAVLQALRQGQRPDGGFGSADREGSDLESTYRVMRAFVMLKSKPADPTKLRTFVAKCRSESGGYGAMPGQAPTAAGTYYAAIVGHWLDQP
jgi:hypothetical protein